MAVVDAKMSCHETIEGNHKQLWTEVTGSKPWTSPLNARRILTKGTLHNRETSVIPIMCEFQVLRPNYFQLASLVAVSSVMNGNNEHWEDILLME